MDDLKIALIGCGAVANEYYVPALKRHPKLCKHLFLIDKNKNNAQKIADQLGSTFVYEDYHQVIDRIDAAILAVPHQLHYNIGRELLGNKIHVLCEKPLAEFPAQAVEMVNIAKENGVHLLTNNTRRAFPSFAKIKEMVDNAEIGELQSINYFEAGKFGWESSTGFYIDPKISNKGVLLDLGAHVLDIISWLVDGKLQLQKYEDDSFGGPESVVSIVAKKDNIKIKVKLNRLLDLDNYFLIKGSKATISGSAFDWKKITVKYENGESKTIRLKAKAKTYPDFVIEILNNFIEVIINNAKPICRGEDVLDSISLINECYENRQRFFMPWNDRLEVFNV